MEAGFTTIHGDHKYVRSWHHNSTWPLPDQCIRHKKKFAWIWVIVLISKLDIFCQLIKVNGKGWQAFIHQKQYWWRILHIQFMIKMNFLFIKFNGCTLTKTFKSLQRQSLHMFFERVWESYNTTIILMMMLSVRCRAKYLFNLSSVNLTCNSLHSPFLSDKALT